MQEEYTFVRGDRETIIETLEYESETLDLTDRVVEVTLRHRDDGLVVDREVDEYVDRENGIVQVTFVPDETARSGPHTLQFHISGVDSDDPTTTPKRSTPVIILTNEQTDVSPADPIEQLRFEDLRLGAEENLEDAVLRNLGGFRDGWVGDGTLLEGLGENIWVDDNNLLEVGGADASPDSTYVTIDTETDDLPNAQQHADLSGADLHAPADHDNNAHTEPYATDGELTAHEAETSDVHGIDETDTVAGIADVEDHAEETGGVHGIDTDDTIESVSGTQEKIDAHSAVEDTHHARYTDSEASDAAPVQSIHGRIGAVEAEAGDYTHSQVGAEPEGAVDDHRQNDIHTAPQPAEEHGADAHDETVASTDDLFSGSHTDLSDVTSDDHHTRPEAGDHLEEDVDGAFNTVSTPAHSSEHEAGSDDELSVDGLTGSLADAQDPSQHGNEAHTEEYATADELAAHETASSGIHGVGDSEIASTDDISAHSDSTGGVHGIDPEDTVAGTSDLYTDAEASDAAPVQSVHGRDGVVTGESGDYTADQVGAVSIDEYTDHTTAETAHHTRYEDSEARAAVEGSVDAADLAGDSGFDGQVLQTDGSDLSWVSLSGGGGVQERGGRAVHSSFQDFPDNDMLTVEFDDVSTSPAFDQIGEFDTATHAIVADRDATYTISGQFAFQGDANWSTGDRIIVEVLVNGTTQSATWYYKNGTEQEMFPLPSQNFDLSEGDQITVEIEQESGSEMRIPVISDYTWLSWSSA